MSQRDGDIRSMERKVNIKQEPRLGDLTLHAEAERVQWACFSCRVSGIVEDCGWYG
jgi:hypothetical protein